MNLNSEVRHADGLLERRIFLDGIPAILWTPPAAEAVALILLGQQGDLERLYPRLLPRARASARDGFASVTLELPGSGERPRIAALERARADLRETLAARQPPTEELVDRLILPLVDQVVPEWQRALDVLLGLPELAGPVGLSGGIAATAVRMARVDPRVVAANLFVGSSMPAAIIKEARQVTIPLHVLLQWDDAGNHRQTALELFDAFGSTEKTLAANMGGHLGVPLWANDEAARFFARHLRRA